MLNLPFADLEPLEQGRLARHNAPALSSTFADERISAVEFRALTDAGMALVTITREDWSWEASSLEADYLAGSGPSPTVRHRDGLVVLGGAR
ncbi:hypothetical protein [Aeromicrobium sp. Leaf291]|uniref:hypothetical protein n=1 Tax=Aeromicrobium sp. Leaf291 TaxID=1736325 RepID=UPI0006FC1BEE|nr:hypothetical protein [Aeromicrobium sp. Leaf291]KQP81591.1 hypothetical protein ASF35_16300 [Aeromicrobium sp. Leaf291]